MRILHKCLGDVLDGLFHRRSRRMDAGAEPTGRAKRRIYGAPLSELMNSSQPAISHFIASQTLTPRRNKNLQRLGVIL